MAKDNQKLTLDISWGALFKIVALIIGMWAIFALRDIILMLLVVFIFVASVNPTVSWLQRYMSRSLAVTFFYVILLVVVTAIAWLFIPNFVRQLNDLAHNVPNLVNQFRPAVEDWQSQSRYGNFLDQASASLSAGIRDISNNLFKTTLGFFGGVATVLSGLVLSFYLLLEERNAREFFHQVLPQRRFNPAYRVVSKISERMGDWVRGQLLLMVLVGLANFLVFIIIGIPSPLPLSVWSGLTEAIPYVGPVLGVIPALIVAISTGSVLKVILVLAVNLLLIQQLEANIAVPKIMGRAIGLSPVLVIISILIGAKLFGLVGALVAIPAAAIISVVVGEWPNLRRMWDEEEPDEQEAVVKA